MRTDNTSTCVCREFKRASAAIGAAFKAETQGYGSRRDLGELSGWFEAFAGPASRAFDMFEASVCQVHRRLQALPVLHPTSHNTRENLQRWPR